MKSYGKRIIAAASLCLAAGAFWPAAELAAQVGNPRGINPNTIPSTTPSARVPKTVPNARYIPVVQQVAQGGQPVETTTESAGVPRTTGRPATATGGEEESDTPSFMKPENTANQLGRYRTAGGYVKVSQLFLDSYKDSVVRITARDEAGNKLNEAMGVAVGVTNENLTVGDSNFIATSLSLVLGNSIQWADKIEITHDSGASYYSDVALIDEQLDLVLLRPKNKPTPIRFVAPEQERAQIDVLTISFDRDRVNNIVPNVHRATLAAINSEEGTLAISGKTITNAQAGTAIINMSGELMGMLLPNGNGVLASAIVKAIEKIKGRPAFHPRLVGAIMGRGVLVDPSVKDAYKTIEEALADIKSGAAPKADTTRYLRAYTDEFKPKAAPRTIVKIAPGTFTLAGTLALPGNISLAGSGPKATILVGKAADRPIVSIDGVKNLSVANLRITPAAEQKEGIATVIVRNSQNVTLLGNVIEAKGGRAAIHLLGSTNAGVLGNSFPDGKEKAIYCQTTSATVEANSFLGKWPQALSAGKGCVLKAQSNLFADNEISVAVSAEAKRVEVFHNTFLRSVIGVRFYGTVPDIDVEDNLFHTNRYSLVTNQKFGEYQIGRNGAWKSIAFRDGQSITGLDFVKGKPEFRNPDSYDYRLMPGSPGVGAGVPSKDGTATDMGAYQPETFLGEYTSQFLVTLETTLGEKELAEAWGFKIRNENDATGAPALPAKSVPARRPSSEEALAKPIVPGGGKAKGANAGDSELEFE